jgi:hypothetical protein
MTRDVTALIGATFGLGGPALVLVCRVWPWPRAERVEQPAAGLVPTAFRYCPAELRVCAAVPHRDGSATCSCGTHIPAGDPA